MEEEATLRNKISVRFLYQAVNVFISVCNVWYFNMGVYGKWLTAGASSGCERNCRFGFIIKSTQKQIWKLKQQIMSNFNDFLNDYFAMFNGYQWIYSVMYLFLFIFLYKMTRGLNTIRRVDVTKQTCLTRWNPFKHTFTFLLFLPTHRDTDNFCSRKGHWAAICRTESALTRWHTCF